MAARGEVMIAFMLMVVASPMAAAMPLADSVRLSTGYDMPLVGIGTWQYNDSRAYDAVYNAVKVGYRPIDTALGYNNQVGVGKAIAQALTDFHLLREDLFIVSKIPGGLNASATEAATSLALQQLFPGDKAGYVDLMLTHFPATWSGGGGKAARQAEWKGLEAFVKGGGARSIGISHYCRKHLDDVLEIATIKPAVNQVQYHGEREREGEG